MEDSRSSNAREAHKELLEEVIKMNAKMKACFTPHVMMHSLFGLGLGLLIAALVPSLSNVMTGLVVMAVAFVLDAMRKH